MGVWSRALGLGLLAVACGSSERSGEGSGGAGGSGGTGGSAAQGATAGASVAGSPNGARGGSASGATGGGGTAGDGSPAAGKGGGDAGGASGANNEAGSGGAGASCPTGTTNHTEGSRIRGTYVVTDDGVKRWANWHDSELDFDCEFMVLNDGAYHCAPNNYDLSNEYFTDADCTAAAYTRGLQNICEPMNYIFLRDVIDCTKPNVSGYRYYELGDAVSAPSQLYRLQGSDCVAATTPDDELFRKGPEVDYSKFVSATYGPLTTTGRLRGDGVTATDGLRQLKVWYDTELQTNCRFDTAEDGVRRCLPDGGSITYFADAACSAPLAQSQNGCVEAPNPYVLRPIYGTCGDRTLQYFASGAASDGTAYVAGSNDCQSVLGGVSPTFVTTHVPPATFQAVGSVVNDGATTRLKPLLATTADGGCWFDELWDSKLGATCRFLAASDGSERCFPGEPFTVLRFFADDTCTTPMYYMGPIDCSSAPPPKFVLGGGTTSTCGGTVNAYRVTGDPVTSEMLGTKWTSTTVSGCVSLTIAAGTYLPLAAIDPAELVEGKLVTD